MINSRNKGADAERKFAIYLKEHGIDSRRGQQHAGGGDSPDVTNDLTEVHFEVKRVEKGNPYEWLKQAIRDADGKLPIVAHRKNREDWIAILPMEVLLDLLIIREGTLL